MGQSNYSIALILLLSVSVLFNVVACVDIGNVAEQNYQEDFQRAFESQLELIESQKIGCLYDKDVCAVEDRCLDDGLFGTCIATYATEVSFTYRIPEKPMRELKAVLAMLVARNYTWHDRYTQCCVRSALICASMQIDTDISVCRDFLDRQSPPAQSPEPSPPERLKLMRQSLRSNQERELMESDEIRDEFEKAQRDLLDRAETEMLGMPAKKLQELLDRHKYDYLVDIPEKKYDPESDDWQERKAKLSEGESDKPMDSMEIVDSDDDSVQSARPQGEESEDDEDHPREPIKMADWLHTYDWTERTAKQPKVSNRLKSADRVDSPLDAVHQHRAPAATNKQHHLKAPESLAERLRKRQSGGSSSREDTRFIDGSYLWVQFKKTDGAFDESGTIPSFIARVNRLAGKRLLEGSFSVNATSNEVYFQLAPMTSPGEVRRLFANETTAAELKSGEKFAWKSYGFGVPKNRVEASELGGDDLTQRGQLASTLLVCGLVLAMIGALFVVFAVQRFRSSKKKLLDMTATTVVGGNLDYRDLCRQRMMEKSSEQREPVSAAAQQVASARPPAASDSPNSSTGSWSEDPIATDMDITTGHLILSYMEEYLNNKEKLESEWASLCTYEADQTSSAAAATDENAGKNRYTDLLPYDHSRVILRKDQNSTGSDYINASYISDSDPRVKSYILTQGPTDATASDFWQMLWECCSVTVVNLTKLKSSDDNQELCSQYWPSEGSRLFNRFEVHLVSEHIWCESFLVRNFYLKNLATGEARTVTMFHFLSWDESGLPPSTKSLLDFRRKVNKSYKGRTSPLVIHCNDGCGRSGAYCLLDLALSRINKGVKEIDLAACLEHLRDQRPRLVKNQEQYEFVVTAIAEEVNNVLKTLPQ